MTRVVLASASPRRRELLAPVLACTGTELVVRVAAIDEAVGVTEDPVAYVRRLSMDKAMAVAADPDDLVIAADTTVDVDGTILGKPADAAEARAMIRMLAGRTHLVHTGVTVRRGPRTATDVTTTAVTFTTLRDDEVAWYVSTGEPADKAGGYAIQGVGGSLVQSVSGSVSNVIGLPLAAVVDLARAVGVDLRTGNAVTS